jgi:predicted amidophosphoribosyltransferase
MPNAAAPHRLPLRPWAALRTAFLDYFLPRHCVLTGQLLAPGQWLAPEAWPLLPYTDYEAQPMDNPLHQRMAPYNIPSLAGAVALLHYGGSAAERQAVMTILHYLKYYQQPQLGQALGYALGIRWRAMASVPPLDAIVPVPLHPERFRQRGYNQAEWVARGLALALGVPVRTDLLLRLRDNISQTGLGQAERRANVQGLFGARAGVPNRLLVVDDVLTTGSTLAEALLTLEAAGTQTAWVAALAAARPALQASTKTDFDWEDLPEAQAEPFRLA